MTQSGVPRRDWIILPLICLLTVGLIAGSTEYIARRLFPELTTAGEDCLELHDPVTGPRGKPNSFCREKIPDGNVVEYRFNSCGDRTDMQCNVKSPGTYRIVLIGTSIPIGMRVPVEHTFAALLPVELSRRTGLKVDLYNKSMPLRAPDAIAQHFDDILAAKPDLILWSLNALDILRQSQEPLPTIDYTKHRALGLAAKAWHRWQEVSGKGSFAASIAEVFSHTRTYVLLCDILYASPTQYINSYLLQPDDLIGYLRTEPTIEWQQRVQNFDQDAAEILAKAKAAHVPLVAALVPTHAQVAMASMGEWPSGYDPYKLDNELRSTIANHGGVYIDVLADMRNLPEPERDFFPVDGHPNDRGHAIFSGILATELTGGPIPALRVAVSSRAAEQHE